MKSKDISSLANPELKFLLSLRKNKIRKKEEKSLAEGYRENIQLIKSNYAIDTLYICDDLFMGENNFELVDKFKNKNIRIVKLSKKVFAALSYRDKSDGIISLFKTKDLSLIDNPLSGPIFIADKIEKPGNLGTMIRTARSFNIKNIIASDSVTDIYNPNVIRSSIGHIFNINIYSEKSKKIISFLKNLNYQIISLDPSSDKSINSFKPNKNYALVIGSEQYGISEIWKKNSNEILKIDSGAHVDSLNASSAAAIAMWEIYKNYE